MIKHKKRIMNQGKCTVCNQPVTVDEFGNGDICINCGWKQDAASIELHDSVGTANPVSLDKARQLYNEGKTFAPDFEDFIEFVEMYGEVEFKYNDVIYAIAKANNKGAYNFWSCDVPLEQRIPIVFSSIKDFTANAQINGILVKALWDKIRNLIA